MKNLFSVDVESYRNYLINYYQYECDSDRDKLEQREEIINKRYSNKYLQTIIENTKRFSEILLEYIKTKGHIVEDKIVTTIVLDHTSIDIYNGCSGGFNSDTLLNPILLMNGSLISEYLLKQQFQAFEIDTIHDSYEERLDDIVAIFPLDELHISCPKEVFDEIYDSNSNKPSHKKLVK